MNRALFICIVFVILPQFISGNFVKKAFIGECLYSKEEYLNELAKLNPEDSSSVYNSAYGSESIYCLYSNLNYLVMGYEYFVSVSALEKIKSENESTKELAYKILPKFLKSNDESIKRDAAFALAYYGWENSYNYILSSDGGTQEKAILYAILGKKSCIGWIIEQYKKIDKTYSKNPIFSYPDKMTYLNCLYHLASPESLKFVNEIISNPKPLKIKSRAELVRNRIFELYPETKGN